MGHNWIILVTFQFLLNNFTEHLDTCYCYESQIPLHIIIFLILRISITEQLSGVVQVPRRCPDRTAVKSGEEISLLSLRLSVSQGTSLGDFLLAPACPIEKMGFLYLALRS